MRILVVDDNADLAENLVEILEDEGHQARSAGTAEEGIERCCESIYDLVLTDLRLPQKSGLDLIVELKAKHAELPIVLFSAFTGGGAREKAEAAGALSVLDKPLNLGHLCSLVSEIGAGRPSPLPL